jgi:pSer/pThr/pTyr-binding forkhead associated (FHA) protein
LLAAALLRGEATAEPHLLVMEGAQMGRRLLLGAVQTVGRGCRADLTIPDPSASRLHVRLTRIEGRFVAADLRSKNGVQVNGARLRRARALVAGDELKLGGTRLKLEPGLLDGSEALAAPKPATPGSPEARAAPGRGPFAVAAFLLAALALLLLGS